MSYFESCNTIHLTKRSNLKAKNIATLQNKCQLKNSPYKWKSTLRLDLGTNTSSTRMCVFWWCARKCDAYSDCGLQVVFKTYMSFKQHSTSALADTQEKYPLSLRGPQRPLLSLWLFFWSFLCWEERPQIRFLNFFLLSSCLFPLEQKIPTIIRNLGFLLYLLLCSSIDFYYSIFWWSL